jgi:hypothetical protein
VPEQVSLGVLRHRLAQIRADPPVRDRGLAGVQALDGKPAQQGEATAAQDLSAQGVQPLTQPRQREVLARDVDRIQATRLDGPQRRLHLRSVGVIEAQHPAVGVGHLAPAPRGGADQRAGRHGQG